jgi:hypothetical protein
MELAGGGSNSSLANMASKGGHGGFTRGGGRGGRGLGGRGQKCGHGGGRGHGGSNNSSAICQLCGKEGHTVVRCFKRFDASFTAPSPRRRAHPRPQRPTGSTRIGTWILVPEIM